MGALFDGKSTTLPAMATEESSSTYVIELLSERGESLHSRQRR